MKLTYRPEIDGLRAIAVVAVILYHAQITILGYTPFKGGFIGVDIFFIISGYLITSIILKELVTTGSFSFKHFYERRIRRILPALLFVMLVSLPFAWLYLLPSSFIDFSKSILYSLGFSSNFYFHYSGQQYGAESGLLKPFLHTWSLSVEEQYYILFPIVLLITFKYFRNYLIHILILGFVISLGLADWGSRNHPSFNFYFLPTRGWELLAGSILAYFEIINGKRSENKILNSILPSAGLLLIGHSILFFNDEMFHPSFYTLSPIIGVCLIIWFSNKDELITKILSTKIFVGIGLISYSLYLWHYPIFAFDSLIKFARDSLSNKLLLGLVILLTSIFSYFFIERPFRNKNNKFKFIIILILISISILFLINLKIIFNNGYKNRFPTFLLNSNFKPYEILENYKHQTCLDNEELCVFNKNGNKKIYLIGDSHAASISFNLKERAIKKNYTFITSMKGNCFFFPNFNMIDLNTSQIDTSCNSKYFEKLNNILLSEEKAIVVFFGRLPLYLSRQWFDNLENGKESVLSGGKYNDDFKQEKLKFRDIESSFVTSVKNISKRNKIILVYPYPEVGFNVPREIMKRIRSNFNIVPNYFSNKNNFLTTSYGVYLNRNEASFKLFDQINNNNIHRVFPHKKICNSLVKNRCITHDKYHIYYSDDDHPSLKGAEMINDLIMKEIEKIELQSKIKDD